MGGLKFSLIVVKSQRPLLITEGLPGGSGEGGVGEVACSVDLLKIAPFLPCSL